MKETILAERYGEAYVSFAKKDIAINKLVKEFMSLKRIMKENSEFLEFLEHPGIILAEKCGFLDTVLNNMFSEHFKVFIKYLVSRKRIMLIPFITDYIRSKYAHGGAAATLLISTYPLDIEMIELIKKKLEEKLANKVNLYLEIDANLLGGIKVIIKNTVMDGSVKRRLDDVKRKMLNVKVT